MPSYHWRLCARHTLATGDVDEARRCLDNAQRVACPSKDFHECLRLCPELFEHRARAIGALERHGIYWMTDYSAVDLQHDVYGLEVCGIKSREGASRVRDVLRKVFTAWPARVYCDDRDRTWRVDIHCQ